MRRYTIPCTEEQTRKALNLGAPIEIVKVGEGKPLYYLCSKENRGYYVIPTAEQMIGWLEEQFFSFDVFQPFLFWSYSIQYKNKDCAFDDGYQSRKEATLAAIDAALDYLNKK